MSKEIVERTPSPTNPGLEEELRVARQAGARLQNELAVALGNLQVVEDQLKAARLEQAEWTQLETQYADELDRVAADCQELEAIKGSRSWRLFLSVLRPYHWLRAWDRSD